MRCNDEMTNKKVLGNKRDLPGALDETGLIERMGLSAVQVNINNIISNIIKNVIIKVNIFTIIVAIISTVGCSIPLPTRGFIQPTPYPILSTYSTTVLHPSLTCYCHVDSPRQDREICCYSISCKEKDNIDITLQVAAHPKNI